VGSIDIEISKTSSVAVTDIFEVEHLHWDNAAFSGAPLAARPLQGVVGHRSPPVNRATDPSFGLALV